MTYYVIQVQTRMEDKYLQLAANIVEEKQVRLLWPRRKLRIRRRGVWKDSLAPIFPGYLFIESELISPELYWQIRRVPGFVRFLKDNHNIEPLAKRDQELLTHFLSFGEVVERSRVFFDENKRIRVLQGPLKGLEGKIVKVNRRKGRAGVKLDLYEKSFLIDFGFELLEPTDEAMKS
ncbi:MAG: antiterminator LoaP [Spirochaeta sp.]|nr:antiterminator LoaP [Spirochaeta sp.]